VGSLWDHVGITLGSLWDHFVFMVSWEHPPDIRLLCECRGDRHIFIVYFLCFDFEKRKMLFFRYDFFLL